MDKINQALAGGDIPAAQALLNAEGEAEKCITDADNINNLLFTRTGLTTTEREALTSFRQQLDQVRCKFDGVR